MAVTQLSWNWCLGVLFRQLSHNIVKCAGEMLIWDQHYIFCTHLSKSLNVMFFNCLVASHMTRHMPSDAIWRQQSGSTLAQVMACCPMAPSHYLNQCWLIISKVKWHSSKDEFTRVTWNYLEIKDLKFHSNFPRANELSSVATLEHVCYNVQAWMIFLYIGTGLFLIAIIYTPSGILCSHLLAIFVQTSWANNTVNHHIGTWHLGVMCVICIIDISTWKSCDTFQNIMM